MFFFPSFSKRHNEFYWYGIRRNYNKVRYNKARYQIKKPLQCGGRGKKRDIRRGVIALFILYL